LAKLVLVLQAGMPPAIATLVLAEEYDLDRELTATALALGYVAALLTLPFWLLLWGT
jgi:predicted permease